jgi:hypothetical protein
LPRNGTRSGIVDIGTTSVDRTRNTTGTIRGILVVVIVVRIVLTEAEVIHGFSEERHRPKNSVR